MFPRALPLIPTFNMAEADYTPGVPNRTGAQLALRETEDSFKNPKAKCPFVPQREMVKKLWGTDADPLAHKCDWEKRLAKVSKQAQFNH